jgi:hypothetical protein
MGYIDRFIQGYITCALWSSTDESREDGGDPLDDNYSIEDIAPETLAKMEADCNAFVLANLDDLMEYNEERDAAHAGHDFWFTRNGHGAGFWDRGLGELGERLSKAAKVYGSVHLYVGDDEQVHQD